MKEYISFLIALGSAAATVTKVGPNEVRAHQKGPGGEQVDMRVKVDPHHAEYSKAIVHNTGGSHFESHHSGSVSSNTGNPEEESRILKDFVDGATGDMPKLQQEVQKILPLH